MIAYSIRINDRQVGVILTQEQLGGNDRELIALAFCNEHNASISCAKTVYLGDEFCALEVQAPETA